VTASLVVRLIGLFLVFASQKIVHYVRDGVAEFVVLLRKEIKTILGLQEKAYIRLQSRSATASLLINNRCLW